MRARARSLHQAPVPFPPARSGKWRRRKSRRRSCCRRIPRHAGCSACPHRDSGGRDAIPTRASKSPARDAILTAMRYAARAAHIERWTCLHRLLFPTAFAVSILVRRRPASSCWPARHRSRSAPDLQIHLPAIPPPHRSAAHQGAPREQRLSSPAPARPHDRSTILPDPVTR